MPDIIFPVSSAPGRRPLEGQGELENCLTEVLQEGGQSRYSRRPAPGLRTCVDTTTDGVCRGMIVVLGVLLVCIDDRLIKIELSGTTYSATDLGELPGTGPVYFAANNASPTPNIVAVTSVGAYNCFLSSAPTSFADADLPSRTRRLSSTAISSFPLRTGDCSLPGSTTSPSTRWTSRPLRRGRAAFFVPSRSGRSCSPSARPASRSIQTRPMPRRFPFSRIQVVPTGLLSAAAIAGYEDGWGASLMWVGDDRAVYRLDGGYVPRRVSTPDLDRKLQETSDPTTLHALVFEHPGHTCWAIIGPDFCWVYDLTTGFWHERASYLQPTWNGRCSARFKGEWIVGHASDGVIYRIDDRYRKEGDKPLVMRLRSGQNAAFPNRLVIPRADFNFAVGQGIGNGEQPIETDPQCWIRYSKDGGNTFSTPVWRPLGRQGEYGTRVNINRLGLTGPMGIVYELSISDPVYATLLSATMEVDERPR